MTSISEGFRSMISTVLVMLLLICLAGLIYPFPPFKTRKRAAGLTAIAFILSFSAFVVEECNPETVAKRTAEAQKAISAAESALTDGEVEKAKTVLSELDYRAADQEADSIALVEAKITRMEILPELERISSDPSIPTKDKFWQIGRLWKKAGKTKEDKAAMAADFEARVLKLVKPLPARNAALNKDGYELLAKISQHAQFPNVEYAEKAQKYSQQVTGAVNDAKSCPPPNYEFSLQVPQRLKDPSSFKPIRVYMGANDGQGHQDTFMDYYATNGFGAKIQQTAKGRVTLQGCRFTLVSP